MKKGPAPIQKILHAVIGLEISKGHLKWRVADLARKVGVSRPLIYYHFGKTKKEILEKSILQVAEDYFGLNEERVKMMREGRAFESMMKTRKMCQDHPAFVLFYLKWRMENSPVRKKLIEIEERYQKMLCENFPNLTPKDAVAFHGVIHGIVTAPFLTEDTVKEIMRRWHRP